MRREKGDAVKGVEETFQAADGKIDEVERTGRTALGKQVEGFRATLERVRGSLGWRACCGADAGPALRRLLLLLMLVQ